MINNAGHPNLDNNAEYHASNGYNSFNSFRLDYSNKWIRLTLEPFSMIKNNKDKINNDLGNYKYLNNHSTPFITKNKYEGIRQSTIMIHHYGLNLSYSNESQWWGPGMHSSIALSSNSPGNYYYSFGTYPEINFYNFGIGFRAIVSEYNNSIKNTIFFSGLSAYATYYSNPIITLGLFRTYLSGNLKDIKNDTLLKDDWTITDAGKLLFEPLFGQSKAGLPYTNPGTPGFDKWDELLSGYVNITFPKELLKLYIEISSDDNRGNISDLKAHWDHTLGYLIGFRKYFIFNKKKFFIGMESVSTKISNTYKSTFWRGDPNQNNYYTREYYDYFSYNNRMMGAHSGTSSDDKIILIGFSNQFDMLLLSINKERHGIKSKLYPEVKTEINFTINRLISKYHSLYLNLEYEKIDNYSFIKNNISKSKVIWLGYTIYFR